MNITKLKELTDILKRISAELQADLGTAQLDECIDVGLELTTITKTVEKSLEQVKGRLRIEAIKQNGLKPGNVELRPGVCQVRIPKAKIEIRKDADIANLKTKLGLSFSTVFEEIVTYKPQKDFKDEITNCDPTLQPLIMGAVEMKDSSPQVFFQTE